MIGGIAADYVMATRWVGAVGCHHIVKELGDVLSDQEHTIGEFNSSKDSARWKGCWAFLYAAQNSTVFTVLFNRIPKKESEL